MKRLLALPVSVAILLAAGCSDSDTGPSATSPDSIEPGWSGVPATDPASTDPGSTGPVSTDPDDTAAPGPVGFASASLTRFADCAALLDHVKTKGQELVGPYGLEGIGLPQWRVFDTVEESAVDDDAGAVDAPTASASTAAPSDGGDFSTTNVQVDGVDEPDIVKTDGERILAVTESRLHYIDVTPDGATGQVRGSVALDTDDSFNYGYELFMAGDRAILFAQEEGDYWGGPGPIPIDETTAIDDTVTQSESFDEGFGNSPRALIVEVDLSNPDALTVVNTLQIEGRYLSARAVGDTVRMVVTSTPTQFGFLYPTDEAAEEAATAANRDIIAETTIDDWLPHYKLTDAGGAETTGQLNDCNAVYTPGEFSGFDTLSVVTLDLGAGLDVPTSTAGVLASGETIYASQDRLYVATNVWQPILDDQDLAQVDEDFHTALHRFSIAGEEPATYEASGVVDGFLLNQFSMNDRDGVLYVATTTGSPWSSESSVSQIVALERAGDRLEQIGQVGDLGKTEQIYSVRYVGDLAYVVTFRQTDPFYVVDLSDPTAMAVRGELKIPGYSGYLHPIGDDLVIGVGQDATEDGRTTGTKVSLFDVSDPTDPREVDVWSAPGSYSDAEFNHRAFLWWAPTNTAVLPVQNYSERFSGAIVLGIDNATIVERGRITHEDDVDGQTGSTDCQVLDESDLPTDSELRWIAEDGGQVQLCTEQNQGGATGLGCDRVPVDQLGDWFGVPVSELGIDTAGFDRFEICWSNWDGYRYFVQRSLVIGDGLWTLSSQRLQSNTLDTLDRTAAIELN